MCGECHQPIQLIWCEMTDYYHRLICNRIVLFSPLSTRLQNGFLSPELFIRIDLINMNENIKKKLLPVVTQLNQSSNCGIKNSTLTANIINDGFPMHFPRPSIRLCSHPQYYYAIIYIQLNSTYILVQKISQFAFFMCSANEIDKKYFNGFPFKVFFVCTMLCFFGIKAWAVKILKNNYGDILLLLFYLYLLW